MSSSIVAQRQLANAFKKIKEEPVEGFAVELLNESNLFEWKIYLEGPKDSPYEGGIFQAIMKFPSQFPMQPPSLTFTSEFWHPNVYKDGKVCISILHPPGEDEMSGELPEERWLPTQTVGTILLSVISMLNDPNPSSAANVDASVQWRKNRNEYVAKCKKLVEKANKELPGDVIIPHPDTNPEEKQKLLQKKQLEEKEFNLYDEDSDDQFYNESEDGENSAFYESEEGNKDDDVWAEHPAENSDSEKLEASEHSNNNNNDNDNSTTDDIKLETKAEKEEIEKPSAEHKKEGKKSEKVAQESTGKDTEPEDSKKVDTKKEPAEKNVEKPQESQPQPAIVVNKDLLKKAETSEVPKEAAKATATNSDEKKQKKKKENCLLM